MEEIKHEKCGKCKSWRLPKDFLNDKGRKLKTCAKCRTRTKKSNQKYKCEHGRTKSQCRECGTGYCEHDRVKNSCKDCGTGYCIHGRKKSCCKDCGTGYCKHRRQKLHCKECKDGYCKHNRQKHQCKECDTGYCVHRLRKAECKKCADPIKITINRWIRRSRQADKKHERYDSNNFIHTDFLKGLIEDCKNECHYCKTAVQYTEYASNIATIERLDNKIGHICSNCVIACRTCNLKHQD